MPLDSALLARAHQGLSLCDEPFAALGAELGLGGDAVVERLRRLVAHGLIGGIGPCWSGDAPGTGLPGLTPLRAATACGLPLVPRPYEALGAMLGWPAQRVCGLLEAARGLGLLMRIAPLPPGAGTRT